MSNTILLPFQPETMNPAQLAAVSYLAHYSGHTHTLYTTQLRRRFDWCQTNAWTRWSGSNEPTSSSASATSASPA